MSHRITMTSRSAKGCSRSPARSSDEGDTFFEVEELFLSPIVIHMSNTMPERPQGRWGVGRMIFVAILGGGSFWAALAFAAWMALYQ
jgi:hypothetical protein